MKTFLRFFFLLFSVLISFQSFSQGKIDKSKQELKKGTKKETSQATSSGQSSQPGDDKSLGESFAEIVAEIFLYITYYSTIGDYKTEKHLHSELTKYPYYNNRSGNYEKPGPGLHSKKHFRFDLDYQFMYSDKNLVGNHFKCNIRPFQYFYMQAQYHQLTEHNINNTDSKLSLYNFNLCYDRLRFEKYNLGWKLGMCYVGNNVNRGGFSAGFQGEAFFVKPVSLYISQQWGSIRSVPVNELEIAGRLHIKRYHLQLGYEHLKIGSPKYDYIFLGAGFQL
ncbi:MAG: hypothetical protein QM737_19710 [Ferruginibacter sp.]